MSLQIDISPTIMQYIQNVSLRDTDILRDLREETNLHPDRIMQISAIQGQFFYFLAKLINAKKTLEFGVYTGYSALSVALALPVDGKIVACEYNDEFVSIAQRYWQRAGVDNKIKVLLGDANETIQSLLISPDNLGSFDMAFIDADKKSYDNYYEYSLKLVRRGGLILIDNTLWSGNVADPNVSDLDTNALKKLNTKLLSDDRVDISMLPVSDGLTLVLKR